MLTNSSNGALQANYECQLRMPEDEICLFIDVGLYVESKKASTDFVAMDS